MFLGVMPLDKLVLFIGAELVFSLTPGPTVMMISAYGFRGGWQDARLAILGTQTGNTLWYCVCAAGLGAMVAASPRAFRAVALAGAAYLIWLGASAIWKSWQPAIAGHTPKLRGNPFVQAILTQIGNPKAALFFGALLPQCLTISLPLGPQYLIMFVLTLAGESVILTGYAGLAVAGGKMASVHHAVWRERVSGAVLILLGIIFGLARS